MNVPLGTWVKNLVFMAGLVLLCAALAVLSFLGTWGLVGLVVLGSL